MNAEIISIGTEILLGDIVNTNAHYLSQELAKLGVSVYYQTVVGDNVNRLKEAILIAKDRADMIITTGGLGPTQDDLSKETVAEVFGMELIKDPIAAGWMEDYFKKRGRVMAESNYKQAMLPKEATPLYNDCGTAPGFMAEIEGTTIVMLPGPPIEMKPMFDKEVAPRLMEKQEFMLKSLTLRVCGIGESSMEEKVRDLIDGQSNPTIAPYAKTGEASLRITAKASSEEEADTLIAPVRDEICKRFGDFVYGENEDTLETVVVNLLLKHNMSIATAESCTGGLLAATLLNGAGMSAVFNEGFITYSNEAKIKHLGVEKTTLDAFGAVSEETAREMALGVAMRTGSRIGVGITGIAGPGGGTAEKPVGLVYIGVCVDGKTEVIRTQSIGDRQKVRLSSVVYALNLIRKNLINNGYK